MNALQLGSAEQSVRPAVTVQLEPVPLPASVRRHMPHGEFWLSVLGSAHSAVHFESHGWLGLQPHSCSS